MAAAGTITVSTERSCSRVTKGLSEFLRSARMTTATPCPIRMTASQKGKNPLWGPSGPQRKPSRMASTSTIAPSKVSSDAVMMSAVRIRLLGEQAALRHQVLVQLFVLLHPLGVLGAGGEGRLERSVFQVLLELGRLVDLLEEARVPLHRVLRHVRGSEDAAQHLLFDVHPERLLHRRNLLPGRMGDPIGVEYRKRADAIGLPVADAFDRVVHGGVDVLADQVDAHLAPALERNVSELDAQRVLELHGDDLVLLLRAGAAHLHPVLSARTLLDHGQVVLRGLVRRLGVDPEDEAVEGHARDRRQVPPVERGALRQRRGEQVGERNDDRVRVAFLLLDIEEALDARPARLVHRDQRLRRKLVLLGDAADQPRHLIRASARAGGDDELDGSGRFPRQQRARVEQDSAHDHRQAESKESSSNRRPVRHDVLRRPDRLRPEAHPPRSAPGRESPPWTSDGSQAGQPQAGGLSWSSWRRNGMTPGMSHRVHISSTLDWKYAMSSSVKSRVFPISRSTPFSTS